MRSSCLRLLQFLVLGAVAFIMAFGTRATGDGKPITPSLLVGIGFPVRGAIALDHNWFRSACSNGKILEQVGMHRVAGVIVPVFVDGTCMFPISVPCFAKRNDNAEQDKAVIRQLIAKCKDQHIPIYLGMDVLCWFQRNADDPTQGLFDKYPDLEEASKQFYFAKPSTELFASEFSPAVKDSINVIASEAAGQFPDADGIVFDLRLGADKTLGFSAAARAASMKAINIDPLDIADDVDAGPGSRMFYAKPKLLTWLHWREDRMCVLATSVASSYRAKRPNGRILFVGNVDYGVHNVPDSARTAQNWKLLVKLKIADGLIILGIWKSQDCARLGEAFTILSSVGTDTESAVFPMFKPELGIPDNLPTSLAYLKAVYYQVNSIGLVLNSDKDAQLLSKVDLDHPPGGATPGLLKP